MIEKLKKSEPVEFREEAWGELGGAVLDLARSMLSKKPSNRPNLVELKKHHWVSVHLSNSSLSLSPTKLVLNSLSPIGNEALSLTCISYRKPKKSRQGSFSDQSDQYSSHSDSSFRVDDVVMNDYDGINLKKPRAVSLGSQKDQEEVETALEQLK